MKKVSTPHALKPDKVAAPEPWPESAGRHADAIDTAAAMIVIQVLLDVVSQLPGGRAALADARRKHIDFHRDAEIAVAPRDCASVVLALALIEAAEHIDENASLAA